MQLAYWTQDLVTIEQIAVSLLRLSVKVKFC